MLVALFQDNIECECHILLTSLIDTWIGFASELFPLSAAGLSGAELKLQARKMEHKRLFAKKRKKEYLIGTLDPEIDIDEAEFGYFSVLLFNLLFMNWSHAAAESECPVVFFPEECLVSRFVRSTIYYVVDWTLFSMSRALTIAKKDRDIYFKFVIHQTLEAGVAKDQGLPTSLVKNIHVPILEASDQ